MPALRLAQPRLWWPNGYGAPELYDVELRFETGAGQVSDVKVFRAGVRQFTHTLDGGTLTLWVNGAVTSEIPVDVPRGHFGLEAEGWRIEFRNLRVKPLD